MSSSDLTLASSIEQSITWRTSGSDDEAMDSNPNVDAAIVSTSLSLVKMEYFKLGFA